MPVFETVCQTALHAMPRMTHSHWDLNIYRGCMHGCKYCFALYSHQYLGKADFYNTIYVKTNIVDALEKQFKKKTWKKEVISIGGVTDSYQPIEKQYQLMPEVLKLLIRYRNPAVICTKSDLILRDFDLWEQLSRVTYAGISSTVTTLDAVLQKKLEPNASSPQKRMHMLSVFQKANISTGVHIMPVIPYLTNDYKKLAEIFSLAKEIGSDYILTDNLRLRGQTKVVFFEFLQEFFPQIFPQVFSLYSNGRLPQYYKKEMYALISQLHKEYQISNNFLIGRKKRPCPGTQLSLFSDDI